MEAVAVYTRAVGDLTFLWNENNGLDLREKEKTSSRLINYKIRRWGQADVSLFLVGLASDLRRKTNNETRQRERLIWINSLLIIRQWFMRAADRTEEFIQRDYEAFFVN